MKKHVQIPQFGYFALGMQLDFQLYSDLRWWLWSNSMETVPSKLESKLWTSLHDNNPLLK